MKKLLSLVCLSLVLFSLSSVSAASTLIAGKVYNYDFSETVANANVTVDCNGNIQPATSGSDGSYGVVYNDSVCTLNDKVTIEAFHKDYGYNKIDINVDLDIPSIDLSIGMGNVPLVPEFGFFVGILTIVSALGIFFVVRRE